MVCVSNYFILAQKLSSQPPVTFSVPTPICDYSPYKLVFYDDFNGNTIDVNKWHTFNVYCGDENDHWEEARWSEGIGYDVGSIFHDDNVVVNNGTCKLIMKHGTNSWQNHTSEYSAGLIESYFSNYFNCGSFEGRFKMPVYKYAHSDFWTWPCILPNSIDIAEAYGAPFFPYFINNSNNQYCDRSLHDDISPNEIMERWPHQTWFDFIFGTYLKQYEWHTYKCDWDPNFITMYFDGKFETMHCKYRQPKTYHLLWWTYTVYVSPYCYAGPGTYEITPGFPWNTAAQNHLRVNVGLDKDVYPSGNYKIGQVEIDYIKAYQRHPELDNHVDLCAAAQPVITGPSIICDNTTSTYTANPSVPGGTWSVAANNQLYLYGVSNSGGTSTATIHAGSHYGYNDGIINYSAPSNGICPSISVTKYVDLGLPKGYAMITRVRPSTYESFEIFSVPVYHNNAPNSPTTFEWNIDISENLDCSNSQHYHFFGSTVTTTKFTHATRGPWPTCYSYTVKITNSCGTKIISDHGIIPVYNYYAPYNTPYNPSGKLKVTNLSSSDTDEAPYITEFDSYAANIIDHSADTITRIFDAEITDTLAYEQRVSDRLSNIQFLVSDSNISAEDSLVINDKIQKIRLEELGPFILVDTNQELSKLIPGIASTFPWKNTIVYPNPSKNYIWVMPSTQLIDANSFEISVIDNSGKVFSSHVYYNYDHKPLKLDISYLPNGIYFLKLQKNKLIEYSKFDIIR